MDGSYFFIFIWFKNRTFFLQQKIILTIVFCTNHGCTSSFVSFNPALLEKKGKKKKGKIKWPEKSDNVESVNAWDQFYTILSFLKLIHRNDNVHVYLFLFVNVFKIHALLVRKHQQRRKISEQVYIAI